MYESESEKNRYCTDDWTYGVLLCGTLEVRGCYMFLWREARKGIIANLINRSCGICDV